MGYNFIPFFIILVSLTVIIVLIIRKFPQLSLLDVDNLPEVKEEKKKEEILKKRKENKVKEARQERVNRFQPILQDLKKIQGGFRRYVGNVERIVVKGKKKKEIIVPTEPVPAKQQDELRTLVNEAVFAASQGDYETAEKRYIAAIRLDTKNIEAYWGLSDVYRAQGHLEEAEETCKFLLQLEPSNDQVYTKLAELAEEQGKKEQAVQYYEQALLINDGVSSRYAKIAALLSDLEQYDTALESMKQAIELEPQNPKYLDMLTEISIMCGDRPLAEEALQELRMVNPENQKISIFKERIDKIKKKRS